MRKEKAALLITALLIAITGCGSKPEQLVESVESIAELEEEGKDNQEESTLNFKGKMDAKGEEFLATDVIIYEFVYS